MFCLNTLGLTTSILPFSKDTLEYFSGVFLLRKSKESLRQLRGLEAGAKLGGDGRGLKPVKQDAAFAPKEIEQFKSVLTFLLQP